jgi:hypothetical protein
LGAAKAQHWHNTLGEYAAPYLNIIPYYIQTALFRSRRIKAKGLKAISNNGSNIYASTKRLWLSGINLANIEEINGIPEKGAIIRDENQSASSTWTFGHQR